MAINLYTGIDGNKYWRVYVNIRSSENPKIRKQKEKGNITSEAEALKIEKQFIKLISSEVARLEGKGITWEDVIYKWIQEGQKGYFKKITERTISDYLGILKIWTALWMKKPAIEITRGDGKQVLNNALSHGLKKSSIKKIKNVINAVYDFGIKENLIRGIAHSPVYGIDIQIKNEEEFPEILTVKECRALLFQAKVRNHPWYYIWAIALNTGMRSGELRAMLKEDIDFEKNVIRVKASWDKKNKCRKSTKKGYWRNVPLSPELKKILFEVLQKYSDTKFLFPEIKEWEQGSQAFVIRCFCEKIGISSIKFHTLRSCFATHLLAAGASEAKVMKIGGWRDYKTFQIYVRLAAIDEQGVTDKLSFAPDDKACLEYLNGIYQKNINKNSTEMNHVESLGNVVSFSNFR